MLGVGMEVTELKRVEPTAQMVAGASEELAVLVDFLRVIEVTAYGGR